jgi:hypothetical protein
MPVLAAVRGEKGLRIAVCPRSWWSPNGRQAHHEAFPGVLNGRHHRRCGLSQLGGNWAPDERPALRVLLHRDPDYAIKLLRQTPSAGGIALGNSDRIERGRAVVEADSPRKGVRHVPRGTFVAVIGHRVSPLVTANSLLKTRLATGQQHCGQRDSAVRRNSPSRCTQRALFQNVLEKTLTASALPICACWIAAQIEHGKRSVRMTVGFATIPFDAQRGLPTLRPTGEQLHS